MITSTPPTHRQPKEDDLRAAGFKAVEGYGTVLGVSHSEGRTRLAVAACGITCLLDTTAAGAFVGAGGGRATPGTRVKFLGRPIEVQGTTVVFGSLEIAWVEPATPEAFKWHVEHWTEDGQVESGRVRLVVPSSLVLARPFLLQGKAVEGQLMWRDPAELDGE